MNTRYNTHGYVLTLFLLLSPSVIGAQGSASCPAPSTVCPSPDPLLTTEGVELAGDHQIYMGYPSVDNSLGLVKFSDDPPSQDFNWYSNGWHSFSGSPTYGTSAFGAAAGNLDHSSNTQQEVVVAFGAVYDGQAQGALLTVFGDLSNNTYWNSTGDIDHAPTFTIAGSPAPADQIAVAMGDLSDAEGEEVVIAYPSSQSNGPFTLYLLTYASLQAGATSTAALAPDATFTSTSHHENQATSFEAAIGNFVGGEHSGLDDDSVSSNQIMVAIRDSDGRLQPQLLTVDSDFNIDRLTFCEGNGQFGGSVSGLGATTGDFDGDLVDEIAFVAGANGGLAVFLFEVTDRANPEGSSPQCGYCDPGTGTCSTSDVGMLNSMTAVPFLSTDNYRDLPNIQAVRAAAGDIDGDGRDELAALFQASECPLSPACNGAYTTYNQVLTFDFDTPTDEVAIRNSWWQSTNTTFVGQDLNSLIPTDLDMADLDLDGREEIVALFANQQTYFNPDPPFQPQGRSVTFFELMTFWDNPSQVGTDNGSSLTAGGTYTSGPQGASGAAWEWGALALADGAGTSIYAEPDGSCCEVSGDKIRAVIPLPPAWSSMDGAGTQYLTQDVTTASNSTSAAVSWSQSTSLSLGLPIPQVGSVSAAISNRIAASQAYTQTYSTDYGGGDDWSESDSMVVFDGRTDDCYPYTAYQGGEPVTATGAGTSYSPGARACFPDGANTSAQTISEWNQRGQSLPPPAYWAQLYRAWDRPNPALVGSASQSSTADGCGAQTAIDGQVTSDGSWAYCATSGSASETAWWQVDLGASQQVTSLMLWAGMGGTPAEDAGEGFAPLGNFFVYLGDSSAPAEPSPDPTDPGDGWTYFPTNAQPGFELAVGGTGRYVQIRLDQPGIQLMLAEVQVLGASPDDSANDGNPAVDAYPIAVALDTDSDKPILWLTPPAGGDPFPVPGNLVWLKSASIQVAFDVSEDTWSYSAGAGTSTQYVNRWGTDESVGGSIQLSKASSLGFSATESYGSDQGDSVAFSMQAVTTLKADAGAPSDTDLTAYCYVPYLYFRNLMTADGITHSYLATDYLVPMIASTGGTELICPSDIQVTTYDGS